jgi:hypothetical protein
MAIDNLIAPRAKVLVERLRLLKQCRALRTLQADVALWEPIEPPPPAPGEPPKKSYPAWRCSIPIPIELARRLLDDYITQLESAVPIQEESEA